MISTQHPLVSVFLATSLDGYIARPDGSLNWLDQMNTLIPSGEDCGFAQFFGSTDVLVMGRGTFEEALEFPEWPYGTRAVIVMTSQGSALSIPKALQSSVHASSETPASLLKRLHREGFKHVYLDGGRLVQSFLREGLVNELTITVIPILIGAGRRPFGETNQDIPLHLVRSRVFDFGYVQLTYAL